MTLAAEILATWTVMVLGSLWLVDRIERRRTEEDGEACWRCGTPMVIASETETETDWTCPGNCGGACRIVRKAPPQAPWPLPKLWPYNGGAEGECVLCGAEGRRWQNLSARANTSDYVEWRCSKCAGRFLTRPRVASLS